MARWIFFSGIRRDRLIFQSNSVSGPTIGGFTPSDFSHSFNLPIGSFIDISNLPDFSSTQILLANFLRDGNNIGVLDFLGRGRLVRIDITNPTATELQQVQEPSVLALLGLGILGLFGFNHRRKRERRFSY